MSGAPLDALVHSLIPQTQARRGETEAQVQHRRKLRKELVQLVDGICNRPVKSRALTEDVITSEIERKLTKYAVDGGHGTTLRYRSLLAKLKAQPERPEHVTSVLEVLSHLAFTGGTPKAPQELKRKSVGAVPAQRARMLAVPSMAPPVRATSGLSGTSRPTARESVSGRSTGSRSEEPSSRSAPRRPTEAEQRDSRPTTATTDAGSQRGGNPSAPLPLADPPGPPAPKAEMLKRWRQSMGKPEVPEVELLRDVIFLLQGINGRHVGFQDIKQKQTDHASGAPADTMLKVVFVDDGQRYISQPTRHLIHRIAELGRLYRRISSFTQQHSQEDSSGGLIKQSLCHFISDELTDYYRLIAILEAHLNRTVATSAPAPVAAASSATPNASAEPGSIESDVSTAALTLKRIAVWTQDVALRLRLLSTIIESCQNAHGGELVSLIHSYTFNGDPFIRRFTAQLLEEVSKPFFHSLSRWIYEGELQDPFREFFVELNADAAAAAAASEKVFDDADGTSLWQNKFVFRQEMLPSFLGETFGRKIFSTGKSLNFIRHSCGDSDWVSTRNKLSNSGFDLRYADLPGLERTIDSTYSFASTRLLEIFLDKFKLLDHLRALKDYMMLTKGDFVNRLMETLGPSLSLPASSLFRHNLTASLETAVRGSNAQYDDADILRRLDARMLEASEGDLGWDAFTLEYKVDSPVNTVLDGEAMSGYQQIFTHLWRIKRSEMAVTGSWEKLMSATSMINRTRGASSGLKALAKEGHATLLLLGEMVHFVRQLQGFCQLEVIEYSWHDLQTFFAKRQGDLDELIESHRAYLNALIGKVLLRSGKRGTVDWLAQEVKSNFDTMLKFATACDELSAYMQGELARANISEPTTGSRPATPKAPSARPDDTLFSLLGRTEEYSKAFQERTQVIIEKLQKHSNLVVRDLSTRLNYNNVYGDRAAKERQERQRTQPPAPVQVPPPAPASAQAVA